MKRMKCVHPRKVVQIMKEFLAFASDLEYEDEDGNSLKVQPKLTKGNCFSAFVEGKEEEFWITYNFQELMHNKGTTQFRKNFIERCPKARGFATITMSLLHELGHFETDWYDFEDYDRDKEVARIRFTYRNNPTGLNQEYFKLPDEMAATDWAIDWLAKKENRIAAKNFERAFFKCFAA